MGVPFAAESWIWFSAGIFIVACRLLSRTLTAGSIKKLRFQVDDWLMLVAVASYTTFIVTINKEVDYNSNLIDPTQDVDTLSPADIKSRAYGSKLTLVVEQMQCLTVWLLKGCLLILYLRLT
jgi:hypothetical protein